MKTFEYVIELTKLSENFYPILLILTLRPIIITVIVAFTLVILVKIWLKCRDRSTKWEAPDP